MRPFARDVRPAERSTRFSGWWGALPGNCCFVLSEAVLVLVIVIEMLGITRTRRIDYEHDYEHEHENWRAKTRWRTALLLTAMLAITLAIPAHADISASASLNAQNAQVGQAVTLSIELKGAQNVEAPALSGLDDFEAQYVGPSTQVSIVNGQMSASVQHRYALTPKRAGRFVLGPFTVEYGGQQYQTNRLQLTVAQPSAAPGAPAAGAPAGERLRVVLTVPKTEVYLHEVLPMEVTLYVGAVQVSDVQYPTLAAEGLSIEPFGQPRQFGQMIEGQRWDVVQFHTSIIPVQAGTRTLGPATQRLNVIERQRQGGMFNDPFFNAFTSRRRPMEVRSDAVGGISGGRARRLKGC